ncbi:MAG: hypothetical protein F4Z52_10340 [Gammaproteobacteria bacterium]|nr:hypothetical protein [Gammaproteobacteria bacterium]
MQTEPIIEAVVVLKNADISEEERLAIVKAIGTMQSPLLDAIEKLESRMDARLRNMSIAVYGLIIPVLFILYQVAPKAG